MEIKETSIKTEEGSAILNNVDYYKFIFKKTEKIACAVFFILRSDHSISHNDRIVDDLEKTTQKLHNVSLESLRGTSLSIAENALELKYTLIEIESKLRVANSARLVSTELLEVFVHVIDSVLRSLRRYIESGVSNPLSAPEAVYESMQEKKSVRLKVPIAGVLPQGKSVQATNLPSRKERVLQVIKDKGEATIKDIIEVITDCSEKTVQRELTDLIKDNLILREGERRWSRYKFI